MAGARYVVLGLAPPRSPWFRDLAQWANAGSIPAEFVKCVSAEEVRARLAGGRPFSALLVDAAAPTLDRDLLADAAARGSAVLVVGSFGGRDWTELGADAALPARFDRRQLLDALGAHAGMIGRADRTTVEVEPAQASGWRAPLVAVTGPGGTGASTAAIALAQGLAVDVRSNGSVLLADLCLHAEQAMLHDAGDVVPGIQEVVDAFRSGQPASSELRALTYAVPARGYSLLLGLRRSRAWVTVRPRAFEAALDGLRRAYRVVVADVDPDLEGEEEGGSADVEDRNIMARTAVAGAESVFVVGLAGMKGLHSMARVIGDVVGYGVPGVRVVPIVNRGPRSARGRAEMARTLALMLPAGAGAGMPTPVFLPERHVDEMLRDGVRIPDSLASPLAGAYRAVTGRAGEDARRPTAPVAVTPGSVGAWVPQLEGMRD